MSLICQNCNGVTSIKEPVIFEDRIKNEKVYIFCKKDISIIEEIDELI